MWFLEMLLAVIMTLVSLVNTTPEGVSENACMTMCPRGPGHQEAVPQSQPMPYDVDVKAGSETVQITISQRPEGPTFMGFMVQARAVNSIIPLGTFSFEDSQVKTITCTNVGDTASHTNKEPKSRVSMTWTPPSEYLGEILIFVTIVEIPSTFWVHQEVGSVKLILE